jgi:hypothetical protein
MPSPTAITTGLFTRILTTGDSPFVIQPDDNLSIGTVLCTTGSSATIKGTKSVNGLPSEPISLPEGVPFNFGVSVGTFSEITIEISSGTVEIAGY